MSLLPFVAALVAGLWWLGAPPEVARRRRLPGSLLVSALMVATVLALPHPAMIEKLLTRLALPVGLMWVLGYAVIVACLRSGHRRAAAAALVGWLLYTAAGNAWVGGALYAGLERGIPPLSALPADGRLDVIMILGGGTEVGPDDRPQLTANGDRLRVAAAAWRRGHAPRLVASGTSVAALDRAGARDLGAESRSLLEDMGLSADALLTLPGPYNTATEVAGLADEARARGWTRIGLITSAWHMRRALRLARAQGLDPLPIGADYRGRIPPVTAVGLVPTGSAHYQVQVAFKEHLARLAGR